MLSTAQKAIAAFWLTLLGSCATFLVTFLATNDTVQLVGGIIAGLCTVIVTSFGVYQVRNQPARDPNTGRYVAGE